MPSRNPNKMSWFILLFAFTATAGIYLLVALIPQQTRTEPAPAAESLTTLRPIFYILGTLAIIGSILWAITHLRVEAERVSETVALPSPAQFQLHTVVALAIAESCSILGLVLFFLGGTIGELARFVAGNMAVNLIFVLPLGSRYWFAWEQRQTRGV